MGVERNRPAPESEPAGEALTLRRAAKLFFLSFDHSQGSTALQGHIFRYLHELYPDWRLDARFKAEIAETVADPILTFVLPDDGRPLTHPPDADLTALEAGGIFAEIHKQLDVMGRCLAGRGGAPGLVTIATEIAHRDKVWLTRGRPRSAERDGVSPKGDPYFSYLVYYGLQGRATGVAEYDRLYADAVAKGLAAIDDPRLPYSFAKPLVEDWETAIRLYYQKHPGMDVPPEAAALLERLRDRSAALRDRDQPF